jgi:hypothetical protein
VGNNDEIERGINAFVRGSNDGLIALLFSGSNLHVPTYAAAFGLPRRGTKFGNPKLPAAQGTPLPLAASAELWFRE